MKYKSAVPDLFKIDGIKSFPSGSRHRGQDRSPTNWSTQVRAGRATRKACPSLAPITSSYSDGNFTDITDFTQINPQLNPPLTQDDIVHLYASKHNPFVYFQNVQEGKESEEQPGERGAFRRSARPLSKIFASGKIPNYSFIIPNQCNDQHGRGNAGAFCNEDPGTDGTQATG